MNLGKFPSEKRELEKYYKERNLILESGGGMFLFKE